MDLTIKKRTAKNKTETKRIRREGDIPAIIYSRGQEGEFVVVEGIPFKKILSNIKQGALPATKFNLTLEGKVIPAIIKDIQYNITTYEVIHLDFIELNNDTPVILNVPIECTNLAECIGVKQGGVFRQVVRHLKVKCLPKDIPSQLELDVKEVGMYQKKMLSDVPLPKGLEPKMGLNTVAVVVGKR